jgi:hypothetical protein
MTSQARPIASATSPHRFTPIHGLVVLENPVQRASMHSERSCRGRLVATVPPDDLTHDMSFDRSQVSTERHRDGVTSWE